MPISQNGKSDTVPNVVPSMEDTLVAKNKLPLTLHGPQFLGFPSRHEPVGAPEIRRILSVYTLFRFLCTCATFTTGNRCKPLSKCAIFGHLQHVCRRTIVSASPSTRGICLETARHNIETHPMGIDHHRRDFGSLRVLLPCVFITTVVCMRCGRRLLVQRMVPAAGTLARILGDWNAPKYSGHHLCERFCNVGPAVIKCKKNPPSLYLCGFGTRKINLFPLMKCLAWAVFLGLCLCTCPSVGADVAASPLNNEQSAVVIAGTRVIWRSQSLDRMHVVPSLGTSTPHHLFAWNTNFPIVVLSDGAIRPVSSAGMWLSSNVTTDTLASTCGWPSDATTWLLGTWGASIRLASTAIPISAIRLCQVTLTSDPFQVQSLAWNTTLPFDGENLLLNDIRGWSDAGTPSTKWWLGACVSGTGFRARHTTVWECTSGGSCASAWNGTVPGCVVDLWAWGADTILRTVFPSRLLHWRAGHEVAVLSNGFPTGTDSVWESTRFPRLQPLTNTGAGHPALLMVGPFSGQHTLLAVFDSSGTPTVLPPSSTHTFLASRQWPLQGNNTLYVFRNDHVQTALWMDGVDLPPDRLDVVPVSSCDPGFFAGLNGSCVACPPGTYAVGPELPCVACPEGTYSKTVGATSSSACKTCQGTCRHGSPADLLGSFQPTNETRILQVPPPRSFPTIEMQLTQLQKIAVFLFMSALVCLFLYFVITMFGWRYTSPVVSFSLIDFTNEFKKFSLFGATLTVVMFFGAVGLIFFIANMDSDPANRYEHVITRPPFTPEDLNNTKVVLQETFYVQNCFVGMHTPCTDPSALETVYLLFDGLVIPAAYAVEWLSAESTCCVNVTVANGIDGSEDAGMEVVVDLDQDDLFVQYVRNTLSFPAKHGIYELEAWQAVNPTTPPDESLDLTVTINGSVTMDVSWDPLIARECFESNKGSWFDVSLTRVLDCVFNPDISFLVASFGVTNEQVTLHEDTSPRTFSMRTRFLPSGNNVVIVETGKQLEISETAVQSFLLMGSLLELSRLVSLAMSSIQLGKMCNRLYNIDYIKSTKVM